MKEAQKYQAESLHSVGYGYKPADNHRWGPGVRDVYSLHYIISGKGYYWVNQSCYELTAGESFLIFPNTEVYYYAEDTNPWEYIWVDFRGDEALEILNITSLSLTTPVTGVIQPENIEEWKRYFYMPEAYGRERYEQERQGAKLRLLLSYYMEHFPKNRLPVMLEYVQAARQFMEINYWKPELSVGDVVRHVNIERTYLFRLFKESTGMSVHQYLISYRIRRACELLRSSGLSVKTVACSVGYPDQLYFSKLFKKMTGATPSQYQKERISHNSSE